jgi:tripartite-type tricarboxylate transporter receptor subunit TctC
MKVGVDPVPQSKVSERLLRWLALFVMSALVAACGGGGGGGGTGPAPVAMAPSITSHPASVSAAPGATATFGVTASGDSLSYQWHQDGVEIAGATGTSYTTPPLSAADNGAAFTVTVSNSLGSVTSNVATLTTGAAIAPSITTQPVATSVVAPAAAQFNVVASGTAPLSYQWYRNGAAIVGAHAASLTVSGTTVADTGASFSVTVSNAAGSANSAQATLVVTAVATAPSVRVGPVNATVNAGQTASFSVTALGTDPIAYQWRRNGVDIAGATRAQYTTPAASDTDNGARFSVAVSNSVGTVVSREATLTVIATSVAPSILAPPAHAAVLVGAVANFSVSVAGSAPLSYRWLKNGVDIPGGTSANYTTPVTTLADNGAQFTVVASNAAGTVTSQAATLTILTAAPAITVGPVAQNVQAPNTATFSVLAGGSLPLAYQWRKNGVDIAGATAAVYTTSATSVGDNGSLFSVVVSNTAGSVASAAALLSVSPGDVPASVVGQPQNLTVPLGAIASFSVTAVGSAPLSYQWRRNGVDIAGATEAAYTSPAATALDNGALFTVVVGNGAGSAISTAALLTVTGATVFPQRAVTLIVPAAAGSRADVLARDLATALASDQGWSIVVSNVGGANGTTAMIQAAAAAADGHTLFVGNFQMTTTPTLYRGLTVNPVTAFAHLGLINETPLALTGRPGLPPGDYTSLAAWIRTRQAGSVKFANTGLASESRMCALMFANRDGSSFTAAPYAGSASATVDTLGSVVDLYCDATNILGQHIETGKVQAYGVSSTSRSIVPALSSLATLSESGLPGFNVTQSHGLHAPQGTPPEVLARLNAALRTALVNPEFVRRQVANGARIVVDARLTPDVHRQFVQDEIDKWRPLIQAAGLYAD